MGSFIRIVGEIANPHIPHLMTKVSGGNAEVGGRVVRQFGLNAIDD